MVTGIVEHEEHPPSRGLLAQQSLEEALEGRGVEDWAHHAYELAAAQTDGAEASHGLSSRRMPQDRVLDLRRNPHATTRTVLLEVTFIQAPQFDVGAPSQATEFFLLPRLLADRIGQLEGAACVAGTASGEIIADTGVPPSPRRSGRRRCSDKTGPSHRVAGRPKSRGVFRRSPCSERHCFASRVRGRPARSPSRKASRPPSSKRRTHRCTVVPSSTE